MSSLSSFDLVQQLSNVLVLSQIFISFDSSPFFGILDLAFGLISLRFFFCKIYWMKQSARVKTYALDCFAYLFFVQKKEEDCFAYGMK